MIPPNVLRWRAFAEQSAAAHPIISANEILAIVWSESTGNPLAINPSDPSYGLMQLTMPIAEAFGGVTDKGQLFNAQLNILDRQRLSRAPERNLRGTVSRNLAKWV